MEIELPYDPAIPLLGIHTEETRIERDTCTPIFIAALFIIARTWKGRYVLNWEIESDIYTLPCVRLIASGDLLYSTGSLAWYSVIT